MPVEIPTVTPHKLPTTSFSFSYQLQSTPFAARPGVPHTQPSLHAHLTSLSETMDGPPSGYTLMVAGRRTGKSAFLRLLLDTTVISPTATRDQIASVATFVQGCSGFTPRIRTTSVNVHVPRSERDHPSPLKLTLIDTPALDFADEDACNDAISDILAHVEDRFAQSVEDERKAATGDHHVHLCIYFLDPDEIVLPLSSPVVSRPAPRPRTNSISKPDMDSAVMLEPQVPANSAICRPTLPSVDITTIRKLSARVNVLPVLACADTLTNERLTIIKSVIKYDLARAGIGFGIFDTNGDPPMAPEIFLDAPGSPPPLLPFALVSPDIYSHTDGANKISQPQNLHELMLQYSPSMLNNTNNTRSPPHLASKIVLGKYLRSYRWGSLDVMDRNHCDFVALREAVFYHMETLQKYTKEYLFHRFTEEYVPPPRNSLNARGPLVTNGARLPSYPKPILAIDTNAPNHLVNNNKHPSLTVPHPNLNGDSTSHPVPMSAQQPPELSPNTANSARSGRQRAKKITVACNFCRSRKLKCDGGRPACGQCGKRGHSCDYTVNRKSRTTNRRRKFEETLSESDMEGDGDSGGPPSVTGGPEPSLSPEVSVSSKSQSRRNSNPEPSTLLPRSSMAPTANGDIKLPPLLTSNGRREDTSSFTLPPINTTAPSGNSSGPLIAPPPPPHASQSLVSSGVPASTSAANTEGRREYHQTELPPIATLPVPEDIPTAHALPPLRGQPSASAAATEPGVTGGRRRTSSASTKGSRGSYGSKIVACNFCRMRKTKCDGGHPACSSCSKRNIVCSYVNDPAAANPKGRPKTAPGGQGPSGSPSDRSSPVANVASSSVVSVSGAQAAVGTREVVVQTTTPLPLGSLTTSVSGPSTHQGPLPNGFGQSPPSGPLAPPTTLSSSASQQQQQQLQHHHHHHQQLQLQQQSLSSSAHPHPHSIHHPQSHLSHSISHAPSSHVLGHSQSQVQVQVQAQQQSQSSNHNLPHVSHSSKSVLESPRRIHEVPQQQQHHQQQQQHQPQPQPQQTQPLPSPQQQPPQQHPTSPLLPVANGVGGGGGIGTGVGGIENGHGHGHANGNGVVAPSNVPLAAATLSSSPTHSPVNELKRNLELDSLPPSSKKMRMSPDAAGLSSVAVTVARIQ